MNPLKRKPLAFFYNLRIGAKIQIGYIIAMTLAAVIGVLAIIQLEQVNATVNRLTGHLSNERDLAEKIAVQIYRVRLFANQYISQGQEPATLASYNQALNYAQNLLDDGDQAITEGSRMAMQAKSHENFDQFAAAFAEIVQILSARQDLETTVLRPQYASSLDKLAQLRNSRFEALNFTAAHFASQARDTLSQMEGNVLQYLSTGDEQYADQAESDYASVRSAFDLLNASVQDPTAQALAGEINTATEAYHEGFVKIRTLVAQQRDQIANRLDIFGPAVEQSATNIVDSINHEFAVQSQRIDRQVTRTWMVVLATIGFIIAAGLVFGTLLSRAITRSIGHVARAAQGIAAGALDQEVPVESKDELGAMAEAFNHMTGRVREAMAELQQSLDSLKASQERQRVILETSPTAILITQLDGTFIYANQRFVSQFGVDAFQTSLKTTDFYVDPSERERIMETIQQQGHMDDYELQVHLPDGRLAWLYLSVRPIQLEAETVLLTSMIDITARKEIEDRLRQSEADLNQAQRVAKLGSWRWDIANDRLEWSDEMFHIFGVDKDDFSGSLAEIIAKAIHPDDRAEVERSNLSVVQNKKPIPLEYRIIWPDQSVHVVWGEAGELILDEAGQPAALTGIILDITERKQAEKALREAQELYENIFRLSPELIVVTSEKDGRYLAVSDSHERITGYRSDEVIGHSVEEFTIWESDEVRDKMLATLRSQGAVHNIAVRFHRRSGELYTALFSMVRVQVGGEWCLVSIVTDISERKKAEDEVRRLNAELEQRVIERTAQLETANKELESFSYSVSHDLRAPLRAIDGFSRILQEDFPDVPAEAARLVTLVRSNAQHMGKLIDDLLKFSRLNRQPLTKLSVEMTELVTRALQLLEPDRAGREIEITSSELPACQGDPGLLLQVWINLLSNAIKFTRRCETAQIQIGCRIDDQGETVYFVRDNGVGFDMQYASKLFGVFQRLHRADEFEGTGVGLALVQRIVQRHGGRIWAESQQEAGATFSFTVGN